MRILPWSTSGKYGCFVAQVYTREA